MRSGPRERAEEGLEGGEEKGEQRDAVQLERWLTAIFNFVWRGEMDWKSA